MLKILFLVALISSVSTTFGQSQHSMLAGKDETLAKNKKLVYDFWRSVLEGGHLELAPRFMTETYIQHNPNVPTGRKGFTDFFSKRFTAHPIADTIQGPLISIIAESDRVILCFKQTRPDPQDPTKHYVTTSFEMLRVENGKIAEHWDSALKGE